MKRQAGIMLIKIIILSLFISALSSCGGEPPAPPSNSVSKKIAVQPVQPEAKLAPVESKVVAPGTVPEANTEKVPAQTATLPAGEEAQPSPATLEANDAEVAHVSAEAGTEPGQPSELVKAVLEIASIYDPTGRFDPFEPLFKTQASEASTSGAKSRKEKRAPQTPLERVALSQLKVTAVIRAPSGNRALVEDATGRGYVVKKGTYIGLNAGRVTEIGNDRIVIEEEIENIMGDLTLQNAELKIQKPAGEL